MSLAGAGVRSTDHSQQCQIRVRACRRFLWKGKDVLTVSKSARNVVYYLSFPATVCLCSLENRCTELASSSFHSSSGAPDTEKSLPLSMLHWFSLARSFLHPVTDLISGCGLRTVTRPPPTLPLICRWSAVQIKNVPGGNADMQLICLE